MGLQARAPSGVRWWVRGVWGCGEHVGGGRVGEGGGNTTCPVESESTRSLMLSTTSPTHTFLLSAAGEPGTTRPTKHCPVDAGSSTTPRSAVLLTCRGGVGVVGGGEVRRGEAR